MELRDTDSAARWLSQFSDEDRRTAALLLDAILITTSDRIKSDIEAAVYEIVQSTKSFFYVAPIISLEDVVKHLKPRQSEGPVFKMFNDYQPLEVLRHDSGSENYLALIARDVRKTCGKRAVSSVTKDTFQKAETAQVPMEFIFIVDNSLSGNQVASFLDSFWTSSLVTQFLDRPRTKVNVHLVCWGATPQVVKALGAIRDERRPNTTIVTEVPTIVSTFAEPTELDIVLRLIRKFPNPIEDDDDLANGLGYGDVGALFLPLGSSAPNNMPFLLTRDSKRNNYKSIFPSRVIPTDVKALESSRRTLPLRNVTSYEESLARHSLKTAKKLARGGRSLDWAMMLLMAASYSETSIRTELGISFLVSKRVLGALVDMKWATSAFTLTEAGNDALRKFTTRQNHIEFGRGSRMPAVRVDEAPGPYYPKSVRGVS